MDHNTEDDPRDDNNGYNCNNIKSDDVIPRVTTNSMPCLF